ncbi:hypothetical protein IFM89_006230 [Coptis chinensis]|uniref:Uncharacterized protein n=1 Tax=Coptis chinensis TaxID=261450 RepID=A0A835HAY1_9MAGN|nr:hypothetical protein IFM89_006230 [Coptis chinensis]
MASDQKKRTLEALEKRFALVKTEVQQQQHQKKKKTHIQQPPQEEKQQVHTHTPSTSLTTVADAGAETGPSNISPQKDTPKTPSFRKGRFAFVGYTPGAGPSGKSDMEANNLTYYRIPQSVHENLLKVGVKLSEKVDNTLHELFQKGDVAQNYMHGSKVINIDNRFLLDGFVQGRGASVARFKAKQGHLKRCRRHMSMKQHRKCGSFDFPPESRKFEIFEPMHEMWKEYVLKLIKNPGNTQNIARCLLHADLYGAIFRVAECKVTSYLGVSGIMVRETAETFGIITCDNKFQVVPKRGSVFLFQADCWKITLHGDELVSRKYDK